MASSAASASVSSSGGRRPTSPPQARSSSTTETESSTSTTTTTTTTTAATIGEGSDTVEMELQRYLEEHNVAETLQKVVERLCVERPDNVIEFMIRYLQKLQQQQYQHGRRHHRGGEHAMMDDDAGVAGEEGSRVDNDEEDDENINNKSSADDDEDGEEDGDDTKDEESHMIDERRAELIRRRYSTTHFRRDAFSSESVEPNAEFEPVIIPKTAEEKQRLHDALSSNVLFSHLEPDEIKIIFDAMFERTYSPGEIIIQQGDEGDNFYVVDNGVCDVIKVSEDGVAQKVATVQQGGSFGELALIYNKPRAATVRAVTDVRVWAIDRTTYRRILLGSTLKKRKLYEEFLSKVEILQTLTEYERLTIADALQPVNFLDGEVIVRQGESGDSFFIVAEGRVAVEKRLPNDKTVQIGILETGAIFGELALLYDQPRAATVVALGPVKCLSLDKKSFIRLLGPINEILKRNADKYKEILGKSI